MGNDPIMLIDPDGKFPLIFHIRSFAPFQTFAINNCVGDGRGFTTKANVTSRLVQETFYETTTKQYKTIGLGSTSIGIYGGNYVVAKSEARIQGGQNGKGNGVGDNIVTHLSGNDGAVLPAADGTPIENAQSPDIDVHSRFSITESPLDENGMGTVTISGNLYGDAFPAAEAFVADSKGNRIFIGVSPAQYGPDEGPLYALWGDNKRPMAKLQVSILVNKEGVFHGVSKVTWKDGRPVTTNLTISEWNKQFENTKTQSK